MKAATSFAAIAGMNFSAAPAFSQTQTLFLFRDVTPEIARDGGLAQSLTRILDNVFDLAILGPFTMLAFAGLIVTFHVQDWLRDRRTAASDAPGITEAGGVQVTQGRVTIGQQRATPRPGRGGGERLAPAAPAPAARRPYLEAAE